MREPLPRAAGAAPSRRDFLKGSLVAGGALVVGVAAFPECLLAAGEVTDYRPNAFITLYPDERIELTVPRVEMGQGTFTSLPMLIAEELEVDLARVILRQAPPDARLYGGARMDQFTGGSLTIRTLWQPMRQVGAAVRMVLIRAAAERWGVSEAQCHAKNGVVIHGPSQRRLTYGQLLEAASRLPLPSVVRLKPSSEFALIGTPVKRLDARCKVDGSALFGIDAVIPGMLFASVAACPVLGGTLRFLDDRAALALPGVRQVVRLPRAVAVVAENTWYARKGMEALHVEWDGGANAELSSAELNALMKKALGDKGIAGRNDGDALGVIAADAKRIEVFHLNPMLAHAPMEPINCTVHVSADSAQFWVGTQVPARARDAAAKILGLAPERVTLNGYFLGGGFGRRLETDYVEQAAAIGKQVPAPVKIIWTREEDIQQGIFRGAYAHSVSASVDVHGNPVAISHKIAGPSNLARWAPGALKDGLDGNSAEGSTQFAYDLPNYRSEFIREDGPVVTGFWRGVGATRNMLVLESFMDELAIKARKDPLAYRLALLTKDKRAHHVLKRAGELAHWGSPLPAGSGRGIALLYAWDTYMAQVVDLTVSASGEISVQRVVCVVDCGVVINPDTVVAQMQGGIIFGLTAALYGEITLKDGRVEQSNFHDYAMLRMNQAPAIEVEIVASDNPPGGVGEAGTAGFGGAFANAVYAATGRRFYQFPVRLDRAYV
jgi:isoquinoline 1-oxidoreductase beta subunit